MNGFIRQSLVKRVYWLIRLRWVAIVSVTLAIFVASRVLHLPMAVRPMYGIAAVLAAYNAFLLVFLRRAGQRCAGDLEASVKRAANAQITLDLFCLAALIHFSGGVGNPFILFFVFHMIIASILLSRRAAFLQATFAVLVFSSLVALEYAGVLPHHCLTGSFERGVHGNPFHLVAIPFALLATLYGAVYLASSISNELREREENLQEANEFLREKDRIQSEYVFRVTHDIKGHLAAIRSCLGPVLSRVTGALEPKQEDLIQRADRRTGTLLAFVKALLELTRMRLCHEIPMDWVSVKDVVRNAISYVEARATNKHLSIESEIEPGVDRIRGAPIYIEETIATLLANSVKYSHDRGKIKVSVRNRGSSVLIEIADTGIGIPKDELPKVFDEFYRATNARKAERDGTGLGLSMARQVVERHGGRIWAESEEGKGTTISFTLPKNPPGPDAPLARDRAAPSSVLP